MVVVSRIFSDDEETVGSSCCMGSGGKSDGKEEEQLGGCDGRCFGRFDAMFISLRRYNRDTTRLYACAFEGSCSG